MGDGIATLRAAVVVDYQNVHLTGHELFQASKHLQRHESLIDPWLFAGQLISARNRAQRSGMDLAELAAVLVYRGSPRPSMTPRPTPATRHRRRTGNARSASPCSSGR